MNYLNHVLFFDGVSAVDLAARFGSPLYIYEASILRRQMQRIRDAFARLPFRPFYAMKANSNLSILQMFAAEGFGCDSVSPGEVFIAQRAGFSGERIWFTCSNVSDDDLLAITDPSIVINVNAITDIDRCLSLGIKNPIAIRVNPDIGAGHHPDVITGGFGVKFGIDLAEVRDARMIAEDGGLTVEGIHAHIGSGVTTIDPLIQSAKTLLDLSDDFAELKWINFGGGMAVPYRPGDTEFEIQQYGESLADLAETKLRRRNLTAILEPGRYLVAQSGTLLGSVTTLRVSSGFEWIGVDTGFNHLVRPSKYGAYHHILNASRGSDEMLRESLPSGGGYATAGGAIIAGNLCESGDVFTREEHGLKPRAIQTSGTGDLLAFCDAGAYGFSMGSHYNARLLPAEVIVDGGTARLIRKRQTFDDLLAGQL